MNNKSQKDIRKVIETINNKEEREYIGIFTTTHMAGLGFFMGQSFSTQGIPIPVPMAGNLWVCPN